MKKLNIIWIVVDSVRTYKSNIDDRDRIAIMDKLGEESIEFTNAITGAPSSILSAASMFTGLPSVFISRHFNDWSFNKKYINSIVNTLKESGYSIYSILNSRKLLNLSFKYLLANIRIIYNVLITKIGG